MAVINYYNDILGEVSKTELATEGKLKDIVQLYVDKDSVDAEIYEVYNAKTDTTEYRVEDIDSFKVVSLVNGKETDLEYEIKSEDVIQIVFVPQSSGNAKIGGGIALGLLGALTLITAIAAPWGLAAGITALTTYGSATAVTGIAIGSTVAALGLGAMIGGMHLLAAGIKQNKSESGDEADEEGEKLLNVDGAENESIINQRYPMVMGKHMLTPFIVGTPWHETYSGDISNAFDNGQWFNIMYTAGYGPLKLTNFKIGETMLAYNQSSDYGERKTIMHGMLSGCDDADKNKVGDFTVKWKNNDVSMEILQAGDLLPQSDKENKWGTLYTQSVAEKKVGANILYAYDKDISDVASEYVIYQGTSIPRGFRTNTVRFSASCPKKIQVELDLPGGLFSSRSEGSSNQKTYYRHIPLNVAVQWRFSRPDEDASDADSPDGWTTFDYAICGKLGGTYKVRPSKYDDADRKAEIKYNLGLSSGTKSEQNPNWINAQVFHLGNDGVKKVTTSLTGSRLQEFINKGALIPDSEEIYFEGRWIGSKMGQHAEAFHTYKRTIPGYKINPSYSGSDKADIHVTWVKNYEAIEELKKALCTENYYDSPTNSGEEYVKCIVTIDELDTEENLTRYASTNKNFNKSERRYVFEHEFTEEDCRKMVRFGTDVNYLSSIEVRVIRLTPAYLDQTGTSSETHGDFSYQDLVQWSYLRTWKFDKIKYSQALNDAKNTYVYSTDGTKFYEDEEMTVEATIPTGKTPVPTKYETEYVYDNSDSVSVEDYPERPCSEEDLNKFCYISLRLKQDIANTPGSSLKKLNCIAESIAPKYNMATKKWYPEELHEAFRYYKKTRNIRGERKLVEIKDIITLYSPNGTDFYKSYSEDTDQYSEPFEVTRPWSIVRDNTIFNGYTYDVSKEKYEELLPSNPSAFYKVRKGNDSVDQIRKEIFTFETIPIGTKEVYCVKNNVEDKKFYTNINSPMEYEILGDMTVEATGEEYTVTVYRPGSNFMRTLYRNFSSQTGPSGVTLLPEDITSDDDFIEKTPITSGQISGWYQLKYKTHKYITTVYGINPIDKFYLSDEIQNKYISNRTPAAFVKALTGAHLGEDAELYDSFDKAAVEDFWEFCEDITDGTLENYKLPADRVNPDVSINTAITPNIQTTSSSGKIKSAKVYKDNTTDYLLASFSGSNSLNLATRFKNIYTTMSEYDYGETEEIEDVEAARIKLSEIGINAIRSGIGLCYLQQIMLSLDISFIDIDNVINYIEQSLYNPKKWCKASDGYKHYQFNCNGVITKEIKMESLLSKILLTGRAYLKRGDENKYEPLPGRPNPYPVTVLSQRNTISPSNTKSFDELPCGYFCSLTDEDDNYGSNTFYVMEEGEVYWDPSRKIEQLSIDYVTDKHQLSCLARFNLACRLYQRESYTRTIGPMGFAISLGDTLLLSDDTLLIGTDNSGRIIEILKDDEKIYGFTTDEPFEYTGEVDDDGLSVQGVTILQPGKYKASRCVTLRVAKPATEYLGHMMSIGLTNLILLEYPITIETSTSEESIDDEGTFYQFSPQIDNLVTFGKMSKMTSKVVVMAIKPKEKEQFELTLSPYNEDLYNAGYGYPEFKSNMTSPFDGNNFELSPYTTKSDIQDTVNATANQISDQTGNGLPPDKPTISAYAYKNYIALRAYVNNGSKINNIITGTTWELYDGKDDNGNDKYIVIGTSNSDYFEYLINPLEDNEINELKIRCKGYNCYKLESEYSDYADIQLTVTPYTWKPTRSEVLIDRPVASENGFNIYWEDNNASFGNTKYKLVVKKGDAVLLEKDNIVDNRYEYIFDRSTEKDGYPEKEDLNNYSIYLTKYNEVYDSESEFALTNETKINISNYGTWKLTNVKVNSEVVDRTVILTSSITPRADNVIPYGTTSYRYYIKRYGNNTVLEIGKPSINEQYGIIPDEDYCCPAMSENYLESEDNYKSETGDYIETGYKFTQTLPLIGQSERCYYRASGDIACEKPDSIDLVTVMPAASSEYSGKVVQFKKQAGDISDYINDYYYYCKEAIIEDTTVYSWEDVVISKKMVETSYGYKIVATNESGNISSEKEIVITALPTNISDVVHSHEYYKDLYVEKLSAISANIGLISKGGMGDFANENNYWALSDLLASDAGASRNLKAGEFRVGGDDEYIKVTVKDNEDGTRSYGVQIKAGNIQLTSDGISFTNTSNGLGTYVYSDSDKHYRMMLTHQGIVIQSTKDDYTDPSEASWIALGQMIIDEHSNLFITNGQTDNLPLMGVEVSNNTTIYHFENSPNDELGNSPEENNDIVEGGYLGKTHLLSNSAYVLNGEYSHNLIRNEDITFFSAADKVKIGSNYINVNGIVEYGISYLNDMASSDWGLTDSEIASNIFKIK